MAILRTKTRPAYDVLMDDDDPLLPYVRGQGLGIIKGRDGAMWVAVFRTADCRQSLGRMMLGLSQHDNRWGVEHLNGNIFDFRRVNVARLDLRGVGWPIMARDRRAVVLGMLEEWGPLRGAELEAWCEEVLSCAGG